MIGYTAGFITNKYQPRMIFFNLLPRAYAEVTHDIHSHFNS